MANPQVFSLIGSIHFVCGVHGRMRALDAVRSIRFPWRNVTGRLPLFVLSYPWREEGERLRGMRNSRKAAYLVISRRRIGCDL
jgi:hypothetical protein